MAPPPGFLGVWREDQRARAAYSEGAGIYRILPSAVAVPSTTRDLMWLASWAHTSRTPLVPRGAGSGMPGHNVGPGVILDLTALDGRPLEVDADRFLATTGAAVSLGELAEEARKHGLRMPVDPSSARWATAGGVAATNAAGPTLWSGYGPVRRWIQALKVVTADGELAELERDFVSPPTPPCCAASATPPTPPCGSPAGEWRRAFPRCARTPRATPSTPTSRPATSSI
ncbi:MAG: FAD-binding oxidoreductase [Gemmatimonadales bacterium]